MVLKLIAFMFQNSNMVQNRIEWFGEFATFSNRDIFNEQAC